MITVSFACNDPDSGNFCGNVSRITIHGFEGCDIELEARTDVGPGFAWLDDVPTPREWYPRADRGFTLYRKSFGCYGYRYGYGNWCWDCTRMAAVDVLSLLELLPGRLP